MSEFTPSLFGLVPAVLKPKTRRILLENFELPLDIGFHDFEIGNPQRLVVTIEVWLDEASFADRAQDDRAWNYDFRRSGVVKRVDDRRFNLQETQAREHADTVVARNRVQAKAEERRGGERCMRL